MLVEVNKLTDMINKTTNKTLIHAKMHREYEVVL